MNKRIKVLPGVLVATTLLLSGCAATSAGRSVEVSTAPPEGYMVPRIFLEDEPEEVERWAPSADSPALQMSDDGIKITSTYEGFVPKMYNDPVGLCTVGFGHLIRKTACDATVPVEFQRVTKEQGVSLLKRDMYLAEKAVMALTQTPLSQGQFDAICDFVYNAGAGNYKKSGILRAINAGRLEEVPNELRRWTRAGGKTLPGLVKRREAEIDLFTEGTSISRDVPSMDDMKPEIDLMLGE